MPKIAAVFLGTDEVAVRTEKNFLQGLNPTHSECFMPGPKPRPSEESDFFCGLWKQYLREWAI